MRNSLLLAASLTLFAAISIADPTECHWSRDISLSADMSLDCDHLQIDDDILFVTNGFGLTVNTRLLTIAGEATIRSYAIYPPEPDQRARPPRAEPNWPESSSAADTAPGSPGGTSIINAYDGVDGQNGSNAGRIVIHVTDRAEGLLRILNQGERGEAGSSGEHGIGGGNGENGGRSRSGTIWTPWDDICFCEAGGGWGGAGGDGRDGGNAGKPGPGGDAGAVEFVVSGDSSAFTILRVDVRGGRIGEGGLYGDAGIRGEAGLGGRGSCGCQGEVYTRMGRPGRSGNRGALGSDISVTTGQSATFTPEGAPYVQTVITVNPTANCQATADATNFWSLVLQPLKICNQQRAVGDATVCTVSPNEGALQTLLKYTKHLSQWTAAERDFVPTCAGTMPLDLLECISLASSNHQRVPATEILNLPSQGSEHLPKELTSKLIDYLFAMQVAHTLADVAINGPQLSSAAVFQKKQLVIEWSPSQPETLLVPIDAVTLEAIGYYAGKYLQWRSKGPAQAVFLSEREVHYAPIKSGHGDASADLDKAFFKDVFDLSSGRSLERVERNKIFAGMRMVMIGDALAVIAPLRLFEDAGGNDSIPFCHWLGLQGSYLDDGMLTSFRFDGLQTGFTELTLIGRGSLSGREPSVMFANLLFMLSVWRTSPLSEPTH